MDLVTRLMDLARMFVDVASMFVDMVRGLVGWCVCSWSLAREFDSPAMHTIAAQQAVVVNMC